VSFCGGGAVSLEDLHNDLAVVDIRDAETGTYGADQCGRVTHWINLLGEGRRKLPVRLLVAPLEWEEQSVAREVARLLTEALPRLAAYARVTAKAKAAQADAEARLAFVLGKRARLMGPAVVRPADGQSWAGDVWLLDKEKGWAGLGYRYDSLEALWADMPDLRPVGAGADAGGPWMEVRSVTAVARGGES
jgi:hypothetical protein